MLESHFLFKHNNNKSQRNPISVCERLCHEKSLILNPLTCHTHSKGPVREAFFWGGESRTEKKGLQGRVRGTLEEKGVLGSHQHLSAKRGACEGKAEAAIPSLGWHHVKLSASSLFLLRGFVSHANSGSGPNSPGQTLHPNWQGREKTGGGSNGRGYKGIAWVAVGTVGMSRMPVLSGH